MNQLSGKSQRQRKMILDGLGSALGGINPGVAAGGGLAAAGAMVGSERQKEHAHKMRLVENEMASTEFTTEIDDSNVLFLYRAVNQLGCIDERFVNLMKVAESVIQQKINRLLSEEHI